ncbi:MAG: hypothetical protein ABR576_06325 [Thermoanaerobaculia bacterium]
MVLHNTVIQNGTYPDAIEYRFASTTGVVVRNNLTDGSIRARDGAQATVAGNFTGVTPAMFRDAAAGDLHLLPCAASAIDQGVATGDCVEDWDGDVRPIGAARDIGADELEPGFPPSPHAFHTVTPCRIADTRAPAGPFGGPALPAGSARGFVVAGRCGVPPGARAVAVNVAATHATSVGNLRIYAGGTPIPPSSVLNYRPGATRANNAIVRLGTDGSLAVTCDQPSGTAHFILDVTGYFE